MIDLKITSPLFSATELAKIAGVDRKLVNLWLERELIEPTFIKRVGDRRRPSFSVIAIFKARLIKILSDALAITASGAMQVGAETERGSKQGAAAGSGLARLSKVIADEGWMHAVKRSVDRDEPLALLAALSRIDDCWQFFLELDISKLANKFGPGIPYVIVPVGAIFASVYRDCISIYRVHNLERNNVKWAQP